MKTLWVLNDKGNSLTRINPATGKATGTVRVDDPYNMYYTPHGKYAIVVAEQLRRLDFRDADTMALHHSVPVNCKGVDHMDFSADWETDPIASCEFDGSLVKVDVERQEVLGHLSLGRGDMPQDVKLSPDGTVFYVADMMSNGVFMVDGDNLKTIGFIPTGKGRSRLVCQPRFACALRLQPRRRNRLPN